MGAGSRAPACFFQVAFGVSGSRLYGLGSRAFSTSKAPFIGWISFAVPEVTVARTFFV
jgi:hypothetical protein